MKQKDEAPKVVEEHQWLAELIRQLAQNPYKQLPFRNLFQIYLTYVAETCKNKVQPQTKLQPPENTGDKKGMYYFPKCNPMSHELIHLLSSMIWIIPNHLMNSQKALQFSEVHFAQQELALGPHELQTKIQGLWADVLNIG